MREKPFAVPDCRYQKGVGCDELNKCHKCGWNPAVCELRVLRNRDREVKGELCRREVRQ